MGRRTRCRASLPSRTTTRTAHPRRTTPPWRRRRQPQWPRSRAPNFWSLVTSPGETWTKSKLHGDNYGLRANFKSSSAQAESTNQHGHPVKRLYIFKKQIKEWFDWMQVDAVSCEIWAGGAPM